MIDVSGRSRLKNPGYARAFREKRLTLGLMCPIASYQGDVPDMAGQDELAIRAESLGFAALWVRDVPLRDPRFGDVGQVYDPWVYLGRLSALTSRIGLGTAAVILPLVHPLSAAKKAASIDQLSRGRFLFGAASGDRPVEFPAFGASHAERGEVYREHVEVMSEALSSRFPAIRSRFGALAGDADLIPKPFADRVPFFVVGSSQQELGWIARASDGWITYPRAVHLQRAVIGGWRDALKGAFKPISQSLYIDLDADPDGTPVPIHLGWRLGRRPLIELLEELQEAGMNHVILNLKYGRRPAADVLEELGEFVAPSFTLVRSPRAVSAPKP